jgi:DMSO/TMAO reductase YedYZ molybdopterin-dependent catalytic subunit
MFLLKGGEAMDTKENQEMKENPLPEDSGLSRRKFIRNSGVAAVAATLGTQIPFGELLPENMSLVGLANAQEKATIEGKIPEMVVLNDKPLNAETPAHFLDDDVTPFEKMFVRNNGIPPTDVDAKKWTLTIEGESAKKSVSLSIEDLKNKFKTYTYQLQLECG